MKRSLILFAIALMLFGSLGSVYAGDILSAMPGDASEQMLDETPQLWFIELSGSPIVDGGRESHIQKEKDDFRSNARKARVQYEEVYAFDTLWNGFSVSVAPGELTKIARLPGVKAVYPVELIYIPEVIEHDDPEELGIEMANALGMTGANVVQSELGYTGEGIRVAVIDTGIDYRHPDLGGGFGPGFRVFTGFDFVGDAFNADRSHPRYNPIPAPKPDPMDPHGHGTHVAGIIGASGALTGVAPDVTFGAYKVFGREGSTTADIMIAAMEMALADGMHVVNMSIGSAFQWPNYPTAQAADRLVNKGVVVVASIGNSGSSGLYAVGAPGIGDKVIGVASFSNQTPTRSFALTTDNRQINYNLATTPPAPPTAGTYEIVHAALDGTPFNEGDLADKIALIERGTFTFNEKALNAQEAGAIGVVMYNNATGTFTPNITDSSVTIPVVGITRTDGQLIANRLSVGPESLTWMRPVYSNCSISSFSSYGLPPDLSLKPDIGAPGGSINSTHLNGSYRSMSGTSMSAPHVAGAVALLLEAHPRTPAQAVRGILQNSAVPQNRATGRLLPVHRQGAGMLDIEQAILQTTKIEPGKLALGESEHGPVTRTLTIENNSNLPVTYTLSHAPADSTGPNSSPVTFLTGHASTSFSQDVLAVPAKGSATVDVTIAANPELPDGSLYGGYIVFAGDDGQTLRVPYAGYKGDYQARTVLMPTSQGYPRLAKLEGGSYINQPDGATFNLQDGDLPYFQVHLAHQPEVLRAEIYDAETGRAWQRAFEYKHLPRNTGTGFYTFAWDGTAMRGSNIVEVPDGTYVVRILVKKALGDDNNPDHWETWTSPPITLARP